MILGERNIPRWGILATDLFISLSSIVLAWLLRFNFDIPDSELKVFTFDIPFVIGLRLLTFILFKTYTGIIQYTSTQDAQRIFLTVLTGTAVMSLANLVSDFIGKPYLIPFSILITDFVITMLLMTSFRVLIKILYTEVSKSSSEKSNVIIYGAGESGLVAKKTLNRDRGTKYKVLAFIDDSKSVVGKRIDGIEIHPTATLEVLLRENDTDLLIISGDEKIIRQKDLVVDTCLKYKVKVLNVPPMQQWINGELSFKQIKKVRIEDLLGRDQIELNVDKVSGQVAGKTVLVTGAAGSIGSEMVRQLIKFSPGKLILLDKAESDLHELDVELNENNQFKNYELVIGDIRNENRMRNVFSTFKPDFVYHAAAYKHVPVMENNPSEAVLNNVEGTRIVADLAVEFEVKRFVFVSTDKAVNPTNVMGCSKRIAEIYIQTLNQKLKSEGENSTRFITTRFGNVLGSNGSVIPLFRKQIESGGPVTVTHADVTRYFMTIPEACRLVLEAGAMGEGGEIFIFDMGRSVKIVDLAKKMILLSGLELGKDIQIHYSGLRPGEKLYEELLNQAENTLATHHPKIMIAKVRGYTYSEVSTQINELVDLFSGQDNLKLVAKMKNIVPEYVSQNSEFEQLDLKSKD